MTTGNDVVIVGSINADLLVTLARHPRPGETVRGKDLRVLPGGKGANQAFAAAQLGASTALVGAVGGDAYAHVVLRKLKEARVDLSGVVEVDAPTGIAFVSVDDDGENAIVVIPGANALVDVEVVRRASDLVAHAAVVVLQGEIPAASTEAAVSLAGGRVVLNLAPVIKLAPSIIRAANPLVVNEHEGALVLALLKPGRPVPEDHAELTAALASEGIASVVLTRGGEGAMFTEGNGVKEVTAPRVAVVDTSGAGDAFVGALSVRLAAGTGLQEAVEFAVRVGAFAVQHYGTQTSYPTLADELPQAES